MIEYGNIMKWNKFELYPIDTFNNVIFDKIRLILDKIYGEWSTKKLFDKIWHDRNAYLFWSTENIRDIKDKIWFICYKNKLQNERAKLWDYIELKTFIILNEEYKGQWIAYVIFNKLLDQIKYNKNLKDWSWILVTASQTHAPWSVEFFKKLWFEELEEYRDKYTLWNTELLLFYKF